MRKQKVIRNLVSLLYVIAVTSMAGGWAAKYAFTERGYIAIGGEYLFIPMAAWGAYKAISVFFNELEEEIGIWKEQ